MRLLNKGNLTTLISKFTVKYCKQGTFSEPFFLEFRKAQYAL